MLHGLNCLQQLAADDAGEKDGLSADQREDLKCIWNIASLLFFNLQMVYH